MIFHFPGISVLILQRHGCEYELQFGLLFANFLKANGFHIKYDVLDSLLIAEMGTAAYYETVEKESDFVIIIFSDNPGMVILLCFFFLYRIHTDTVKLALLKPGYINILTNQMHSICWTDQSEGRYSGLV